MLVVLLCESTELTAQALTEESETVGRHDVCGSVWEGGFVV